MFSRDWIIDDITRILNQDSDDDQGANQGSQGSQPQDGSDDKGE